MTKIFALLSLIGPFFCVSLQATIASLKPLLDQKLLTPSSVEKAAGLLTQSGEQDEKASKLAADIRIQVFVEKVKNQLEDAKVALKEAKDAYEEARSDVEYFEFMDDDRGAIRAQREQNNLSGDLDSAQSSLEKAQLIYDTVRVLEHTFLATQDIKKVVQALVKLDQKLANELITFL